MAHISAPTKEKVNEAFKINNVFMQPMTYSCSVQEFDNLIKYIKDKQTNPPQFQVRGNYVCGNDVHNCTTWAQLILSMIGVNYQPNIIDNSSSAAVSCQQDTTSSSPSCTII
jgi:hypothetical protein